MKFLAFLTLITVPDKSLEMLTGSYTVQMLLEFVLIFY